MAPDKKSNLIKFGLHCALSFWAIYIFAFDFVLPFMQGDGLSWRNKTNEYFGSDFLHYYVSGVMARSVDSHRIYDVSVHYPYINSLIAPREITRNSCINYTPQMIAIMSLVSLLPVVPAYVLWTSASLLFGVSGLFLLLKRMGQLSKYQVTMLVVFAGESFFSVTGLRMGQWTWWLIGFFCYFFYLSLQKRQILAGISLGFLTFKPQYCLPLLILTAIERRWLALILALCTTVFFVFCGTCLLGLDNVLHYPQLLAALNARSDLRFDLYSHCSVRGLLSYFLPQTVAIMTTGILYLLALGAFAAQCFLKRKEIEDNLPWLWAIGLLVSLIFSPLIFQYDVLLVCAAAALTLKTLNPWQINQLQPLSLKIWHWIFFFYPLFSWVRAFLGNDLNFIYAFVNATLLYCAIRYLNYRAKQKMELSDRQSMIDLNA